MKMPHDLTSQEIRLLQEFRRLTSKQLTRVQLEAVRHPFGKTEPALAGLLAKGFVVAAEAPESFALTEKGESFLAYDPVP
jgi:hypothetical protein